MPWAYKGGRAYKLGGGGGVITETEKSCDADQNTFCIYWFKRLSLKTYNLIEFI